MRKIHKILVLLCCLTLVSVVSSDLTAQEVEVKHLVSNLENPTGIAINSETGHVFVATRYAVYRYVPHPKTDSVHIEIANYPTDIYGKGDFASSTKFNIGPLGLAFMDKDHLVVADGSRIDVDEVVRVYKIGAKPLDDDVELDEKKAAFTLGPMKPGDKTAAGAELTKPEGNYYGVAIGAGAIWITCNGDDTKGWIAKSEIKDGKPGNLVATIATKEATSVDAPVAITFTPDGKQLVVGQMGEMNVKNDSLLTFYDPATGKMTKNYKTGLNDITGLAYSPITKKLYATDFAWADQKEGGLFELTIEGDKVTAKKIVELDKPGALAFDKDGNLYLAVFKTRKEGDKPDKSPGGLYKISADQLK